MTTLGALRRHTWILILVAALLLTAVPTQANASEVCPPGADACVIVNTVRENNKRDDLMTLREALLVANGQLDTASLTVAEQGQVHEVTELGFAGYVEVNFDADAFPHGAHRVIELLPPGLGGGDTPDTYSELPPGLGGGDGLESALPPGLGGGDDPGTGGDLGESQLPPGLGGVDAIGGAFENGERVPVSVTIDGGLLGSAYAGLWNSSGGTLRDLHFANFAGHAIGVADYAVSDLVFDGVTFENNSADVVAVVSAAF